jgi:hypothetical protein
MLKVIMLSVNMLSVVMLSVVAPSLGIRQHYFRFSANDNLLCSFTASKKTLEKCCILALYNLKSLEIEELTMPQTKIKKIS